MDDAWRWYMMRSESSNYMLGRLDKELVLKPAYRPRYQVQDGSWKTTLKSIESDTGPYRNILDQKVPMEPNRTKIEIDGDSYGKTSWKESCSIQLEERIGNTLESTLKHLWNKFHPTWNIFVRPLRYPQKFFVICGTKNTAKRNMFSAMCALSIYSRLCMKMLSFLFVRAWAMSRKLHLSCGIPFLVWMPGIVSGLTWVVV